MSSVEDVIAAAGGTVPQSITCPSCGRRGPPSTFKDVREDVRFAFAFICGAEFLERERDDAETARRELPETWESERGNDVRAERNRRLDACVWTVLPGSPLTPECRAAWAAHRAALNAITISFAAPKDVIWPTDPELSYAVV